MIKVLGIKFKPSGKVYYFDPAGYEVQKGQYVIVETARGAECGEVVQSSHEVTDASIVKPLKPVIRIADDIDIRRMKQNREDEQKAFRTCEERILAHKLDMKLIEVEYTLDRSKILFYFTADGRIDFRDLVKDLAGVFHTRIELRQIGVRDESKMLGGLGICGQPFCCSRFLNDFQPVSIKMAKEQGLSLNPTKISGSCGRLMCCLAYEQPAYEYLNTITPPLYSYVRTPDGEGQVVDMNIISGTIKVKLENVGEIIPRTYKRDELSFLRTGKRQARGNVVHHQPAEQTEKPKQEQKKQEIAKAKDEKPVNNNQGKNPPVNPNQDKPKQDKSRFQKRRFNKKPNNNKPKEG